MRNFNQRGQADDWLFVGFIAALFIPVALVILLAIATGNVDDWTKQFNGCYVHKWENNRLFGTDTRGTGLYCPSSTPVQ